jgi:dolichyl-phosphate-mannose--protein O-mannosyl transferase
MDQMYFDEVYHARTALENIEHLTPYEITHPPLGKIILSIGIRLFGMNPFGWRCMGTLFGVLMLPLMYIFAKRLFGKPLFAFIPTALFALDFMHYTQTRIATIDSYSVFFIMLMYYFMYLYTETNYNRQPLKKSLLPLALTGVAFGLGAATKWLCIYAGAGLAVILGIQIVKRYNEYRYARMALAEDSGCPVPPKPPGLIRRLFFMDQTEDISDSGVSALMAQDEAKNPAEGAGSMPPERRAFLEEICRSYLSKTFITLLWCVLFFIVVPLIIYVLAYTPYIQVTENPYDFNDILQNQEYMFNYHSTLNPDHVHPFSSQWYLWPIDVRPVFFFQGQGYPEGYMSSMSSMGNPAIWWGGLGAIITLIVIRIRKGRLGQRTLFLSIAALSEYLPWVLITRETFIYHYFATVPFLILLMAVLAKYLIERTKHGKKAVFIYLGVCLVLFAMFYPVTTGTEVSRWYSDTFLRWLPSWPFY